MNKTQNLYLKLKKPTRVVILGSKGFIASGIKSKLKSLNIKNLPFSKYQIDLTKKSSVKKLSLKLRDNDVLIFISAEAPVKNNKMLINNVKMCSNVIESIKNIKLGHLIYLSSDAVYKDTKNKINENSCAEPNSLHGIMHLTRENMINNSVNCPICIIRPTLIYGANDPHNGYGPNKFLKLSLSNKDINLFGKGEELRDHIYIEDVIEIIKEIILYKTIGKVNAVTGNITSFHKVAKLVIKDLKSNSKINFLPRKGEMPHKGYRSFDNSIIKKLFPSIKIHSLDKGLKKTIKVLNLSL